MTIVEGVRQVITTIQQAYPGKSPKDIPVADILDSVKEIFPDLIDYERAGAVASLRHTIYEERRKMDPSYVPSKKNKTEPGQDGSLTPDAALALFASISSLMDRFPSGDEFNDTVREIASLLDSCGGSVDKLLAWSKIITVKRIQP